MKFTKMHGIGNDYIYVNCFEERVADPGKAAVFLSDRHFGVGADGLILIKPSKRADFEMDMYNADGSRGRMCGNGIRCVAKYVFDKKLTDKTKISIDTLSGVKYLELFLENGQVQSVRVDMGQPVLAPAAIPVLTEKKQMVEEKLDIDGQIYGVTCVSMGNPHAVVFVDDPAAIDLERVGPLFEKHPIFPEQVNTEFVSVLDRQTLQMRVWERGSGETLACGTGACAACVAAVLSGRTERCVTVRLLGGTLSIEWNREEDRVYMTGPAVTVFEGEIVCE